MKIYSSLCLLAALGVMSGAAAAAVDTSQWTCESCPYPEGTQAKVEAGLGYVSDASPKFGDYTGLQKDGTHLVLGGEMTHRAGSGYWAQLAAQDLGLDSRSLAAQVGREGLYRLTLGYAGIPRHFGEGRSPFTGVGSSVLSLPAGYPAGSTSAMPLAATLQPVELGLDHERVELGGVYLGTPNWTWQVDFRRDSRSGTRPMMGSFSATTTQLPAPVDHATDQLEVSAVYATRQLQARLGYQASRFRNQHESLVWANPFGLGYGAGRLALAPDNQFHQVVGSVGYQLAPKVRASADFALGRATQDQEYVDSSMSPSLSAAAGALPAASLDGRVDTFHGSVRLSAEPLERLRVHAAYLRNVRDNRSPVATYPTVATDLFLSSSRTNTPYDLTQDRLELDANYRTEEGVAFSAGVNQDNRSRNYHEAVETRETTVWGKVRMQATETIGVSMKLAQADRSNDGYGVAWWFGSPENPLMRKAQLAPRTRSTAALRADIAVSEELSIGLNLDHHFDDYRSTAIGLQETRATSLGADLSYALSEATQLSLFAQGERGRTLQSGSQTYAAADWTARHEDRFDIVGLGLRHAAIPDKLDLGADLTVSRARSDISVSFGTDPAFPSNKTSLDGVKLHATYKLSDQLSIKGSWWVQEYDATDWKLDGVLPATVYNLLALGLPAPQYKVHALRVALRYSF